MLLYLYCLLAGCFCHSFAASPQRTSQIRDSRPPEKSRTPSLSALSKNIPKTTVLQNTMATLPCPHTKGDVSWSRLIRGEKVTLVTIVNGREEKTDKRYGSQSGNSLVITNVKPNDSAVYWCNGSEVYLDVTTSPNTVAPNAGNVPVTPRNDGLGFGPGPGQKGAPVAGDEDNQQSSDFWKVPVGVVIGAALVLLAVLTLRFGPKKRAETNTNQDKTVTEVIYEEIESGEEQSRRESDVESPYYWTSITETQSTSTPPNNNLYSTVNKLKTKGRSTEECVYYLAQNPPQTGKVTE